jgi:hypothetical protein
VLPGCRALPPKLALTILPPDAPAAPGALSPTSALFVSSCLLPLLPEDWLDWDGSAASVPTPFCDIAFGSLLALSHGDGLGGDEGMGDTVVKGCCHAGVGDGVATTVYELGKSTSLPLMPVSRSTAPSKKIDDSANVAIPMQLTIGICLTRDTLA